MDLKNNRITIKEILVYPRGKAILNRNFPIVMLNPFLLKSARNMTLANVLKLAQGAEANNQIDKLLCDLESL